MHLFSRETAYLEVKMQEIQYSNYHRMTALRAVLRCAIANRNAPEDVARCTLTHIAEICENALNSKTEQKNDF